MEAFITETGALGVASRLKPFHPEHSKAVEVFYGKEHLSYATLLESFAGTLERDVAPLSPSFDVDAGGIGKARRILFEHGISRMPFGSHGGLSLPFGIYSLAMELTASADAPTAMSLGIHGTVAECVSTFGTEVQKDRYLGDLLTGKKLASFSLTEPSSGSDARSMHTRAAKKGSGYVIDGTKTFITNAGEADLYLVFAAVEGGHSAFLVDRSNPGLTTGPDMPKLGMRGSRTAEVVLEGCEVSGDSLVGEEGRAFEYVKGLLNGSRIIMGSICVGIAMTAYYKSLDYSRGRRLFEKNLSDLQMTREKIANMRSDITVSRSSCLYACRLKELGADYWSEAAQAKLVSTEAAARVCDQAIQLFGGYGYTNADVHRHWRDARLLSIGEGASEVLRMVIASRELGA